MEKNDEFNLDLEEYNYNELLNLYGLSKSNDGDIIKIMDKKLLSIQSSFPEYIYIFYLKVYKIISVIYLLHNKNKIRNDNDIEKYINRIKSIKLFERETNSNIENIVNGDLQKDLDDDLINIPKNPVGLSNNDKNIIIDNYPNNLAPGNLNSLKRITQQLNLNLNSCFRNNYYTSSSSDFQYTIPSVIKNVTSMRLASIEIPNSWYLFSNEKKNNSFIIEVTINNVTTFYPIVVPDGNYDSDTLVNYLNTIYFNDSTEITNLSYITFSINKYNHKSKFELIGVVPKGYSFNLIFTSESVSLNMMDTFGWALGFRLGSYKNINKCIYSEGLFDGGGDRYIYLSINDYQYNSNALNIVGFDKSIMEENIIAKIPMVHGKLSLIIDDNNNPLTKTRKYNGPVNLRNLQIKILDRFGCEINLNNMDFSFTLELELLYEGFNFKNITF